MTNVLNQIKAQYPQLKSFNVTEAFVMHGELYMTSEYDIDMELYNEIEESIVNS